MTRRLWFTKGGVDLVEGIELRNGRANPWGWSVYEVWYTDPGYEVPVELCIGRLYCGEPQGLMEGFGYRVEEVP